MEHTADIRKILELMDRPAFYVREGTVVCANAAARSHLVCEGAALAPMLGACRGEYQSFSGGTLSLPLTIGPAVCCASVERLDDGDLFVLAPDSDDDELRALALAAQQLRLPLNQLMSAADELFPRLARDREPEEVRQLAAMNRSLYQLLRLVLNMSDARQSTAARMELQDLTAVLQEVFDRSAQLVQEAGRTLRFTNLPQSIYSLADSSCLERAVYNLISNALRHSGPGCAVEARLTRKGSRLYLTVCNSGGDAAPAGAFSRFLREPGLEDSRNGLGLGMRLVQSAAAAHGGTVLMEPVRGGMKVTMSIAIRQDGGTLRSPALRIDYAGERSHALIELSDQLPGSLYRPRDNSR